MLLLAASHAVTAYESLGLPHSDHYTSAFSFDRANSATSPRYIYTGDRVVEQNMGHSLLRGLNQGLREGTGSGGRSAYGLSHNSGREVMMSHHLRGHNAGGGSSTRGFGGHGVTYGVGHGPGAGYGVDQGIVHGIGRNFRYGIFPGLSTKGFGDVGGVRGFGSAGLHDEFSYGESKVIQGPTYLVQTYGGHQGHKFHDGKGHRGGPRGSKIIMLKERERHGH